MQTLQFLGKPAVENYHLVVPFRPLLPDSSRSLSSIPTTNDNLIIHGDNLHALKALLPEYEGKVTCIYIDPPYNTGNENWAYNDNVSSPVMQEWLHKTVNREDQSRHDKWLCMMMPRLQLLHQLLNENGVIFISIDDTEVHHLRMLMDETFGEANFKGQVMWQRAYSPRMDKEGKFSTDHEHLLVYARSEKFQVKRLAFEQNIKQFSFVDETGKPYRLRSVRKEGKKSLRQDSKKTWYAIPDPDGQPLYPVKPDGTEGNWRMTFKEYKKREKSGKIEWQKKEKLGWQVYAKQYFEPIAYRPPSSVWLHQEVGHNHGAAIALKSIVGSGKFDSPKPVQLIKRILELATDQNSIILDSFAGSGTTAQAVLETNKHDGGNRRFILIEMEEYADTLTAERVRRVIRGLPNSKNVTLQQGLGGSFSYYTLGEPVNMIGLLSGTDLPSYLDLGRLIFYNATGETFNQELVQPDKYYLGESLRYSVWMLYSPNHDWLRKSGLTKNILDELPSTTKQKLIFAPARYVELDWLRAANARFVQLPFEMFRFQGH